ncbi:MAG TPA: hypothetical protein PK156_10840 [Polyangium sp.]|nr:hypothetical protein [Polyangium sp.]
MSKQHAYTGRAGQFAVMAEFIIRGYNVAMPEIDIGDDIFVVKDSTGDLSRIQVKTAIGKAQKTPGCCSAQFNIGYSHLKTARKPEITYVFVARIADRWSEFVVIPRQELYSLRELKKVGSLTPSQKTGKQNLVVTLAFKPDDVICSKQSLQQYRNCWDAWPIIDHQGK